MTRGRVVTLLCALLACVGTASASAAGITNSGDDLRAGWYPDQPSLTPRSQQQLRPALVAGVDGQVYAQPLVQRHVLVATESNRVYGLDSETGARSGADQPRHAVPTPIGRRLRRSDAEHRHHRDAGHRPGHQHGVPDAQDLRGRHHGPARLVHRTRSTSPPGQSARASRELLSGTAQNAPGQTFDATTELQRPGLLLMDGVVYAGFGGHCDIAPYQGWVFGVSTSGAT